MYWKEPLAELLGLIEEEPEERTLEALAAEGVIRLFEEPQHSKKVLLLFQSKYGVHSLEVAAGNPRVTQLASEQDLTDWQWAIGQFVAAGGILELLPAIPHDL